MKKLITILLLMTFCFVAQQARAQFNLGVHGGINFSNLNDAELETESLTSFMGGFFFQFPIENSPIVIQPEVLYSQKKYRTEEVVGSNSDIFACRNSTCRITTNLDYIETPVLIRFNYVSDSELIPYVELGPYLGFLINSEQEIELNDGNIAQDLEEVENVDFGFTGGVGIGYNRFSFGARYSKGLKTISEDDNLNAKNGVFSIFASIGF